MFMLQKTLIYAIKIFKICFKICLIKRHYMPKKCTKYAQKYNYISKKYVQKHLICYEIVYNIKFVKMLKRQKT